MKLNDFKDVMNKSFGSRHENIPAEESILNNEQDTREYMEKYTTTEPQQKLDTIREVTISSRTIYHKYCEVTIEIPKDIKQDEVSDWLFENENDWNDAISDANATAELEFGFGLGGGMDNKEEEHEMRFDILGENFGGHI